MPETAPGWYNDPHNPGLARWWNGVSWADETYPLSIYQPTSPTVSTGGSGNAARPTASRRSRWLLATAIVIAGLILITVAIFAIPAVPRAVHQNSQPQQFDPNPLTKGTSTSPPVPAPILTKLTLPELSDGAHELSAGGILTEENSEFTLETGNAAHQKVAMRCAPLTFDSPVGGGPRNSVNPVESLPGYASADGTTTVTGGVQALATTKDAINLVAQLAALLKSCAKGFSDGGGNDSVSRTAISYSGGAEISWTQSVQSPSGSFVIDTVNIQEGRFVARSYCRSSSASVAATALCTDWTGAVAASLATAH